MLSSGKLGFWGLTALVFGLVVGVGIYNLPENMARVASPGAVGLSWLITGAGILPLVFVFKWLSTHYPQYNAGIYQYAQAGFGNYIGFNIAWGYWLCTAFSNVAYGVMLNDALGAIFPSLLKHEWETIIFVSILIWVMYAIVARGIQTAKFINNLLAVLKVVMLLFIISVFVIYFRESLFSLDMWGSNAGLGSITDQIKSTMMVTLFCFFGVEGAVMMSARAKNSNDVGRAGVAGFLISLVLYLSVVLLCFGLMSQSNLASLPNPSIAYILRDVCGGWAYWTVIGAIIISLLGGWVSWTLVVAQVPYEAAKVKMLPKVFLRVNKHGMPTFGLISSSVVMMFFIFLVTFADDIYLAALQITGLMIIPCYFFAGLFMFKISSDWKPRCIAIITVLFCLWMAYAGDLKILFMTSVFYLLGIGFYIQARKDWFPKENHLFSRKEVVIVVELIIASIITIFELFY